MDTEISKKLEGIAQRIDSELKDITGEQTGFFLYVYGPERGHYISNVRKEISKEQLIGLLEHWKNGGMDIPGHVLN